VAVSRQGIAQEYPERGKRRTQGRKFVTLRLHLGWREGPIYLPERQVSRDKGELAGVPYRTGRSIGVAYLEAPELKAGDMTVLQAGMTFAGDGGISIDGVTAGRIGDSIVVTDTGFD
jgi:Xaa-Pro aminopeptidase